MGQPVALYIPDAVVSEVAAIAAPSDTKSGVEQLRKLLDTKGLDPVAARIWAAQGWTLAHGRRMAAEGRGDKAAAKAAAALEGAFLRLHNDLMGRGLLGRTFGSAKEPFLSTLRLAAQRREEQSAAAAERSAAALVEVARAIPEVLAQLTRQADAAERQAKAAEAQATAAAAAQAKAEAAASAVADAARAATAAQAAGERALEALPEMVAKTVREVLASQPPATP